MTVPDERLRSSFGRAAAAYAEHRPDYARDAVRRALGGVPDVRVLDLGAGTGKLTRVLVDLGARVTAVEPDVAMLAELRRQLPGTPAEPGSAEAIPLPDDSVDVVVAGHAMHWFDMAVAGPEIARVLVPGGSLAGLWNVLDDRVDWVSRFADACGSAVVGPRDTLTAWPAATAASYLPRSGPATFGSPERFYVAHPQRHTVESLVASLATRAGVLVMTEEERIATLDRVRRFLEATHGPTGRFDVPMLTAVLRVAHV